MSIPEGDKKFLREKVLPYFRLRSLSLGESSYKGKWPDLWVDVSRTPPLIVVTREWTKQRAPERRKRLVHEALHLCGLEHPPKGRVWLNGLCYSTFPAEDTFSMAVYKRIIAGEPRWSPRRF